MSPFTRVRSARKHRGKSPAQVRRELDRSECTSIALATENGELAAERNQLEDDLDTAGINLSGARHDLAQERGINERLTAELTVLRAKLAAANAIDVRAGQRPIDPGDEPTQPVMTLPEAARRGHLDPATAISPVVRVAETPGGTDPARITWPAAVAPAEPEPQPEPDGDPDATQQLKVPQEVTT